MRNGSIESFNGKFRDECLNDHWFETLSLARAVIAEWRQDYNKVRATPQLPTEATRQVLRVASAEFCRCNATHHQKNPLA
jgi:putative transposase